MVDQATLEAPLVEEPPDRNEGVVTVADGPLEPWARRNSSDGQTFAGFTSLTISMISLGCVLLGYLSGDDVVPLLIISGAGLLIASAWYAKTKLFRLSLFFGAFGGFIYTYVLIQLGLTNRWYGIPIQHLTHLVSTYFSIWFVIFLIVAVAVRFMSPLLTATVLVTDLGVAVILLANIRGSLDLLSAAAVPFLVVPLLCIAYLGTTTLKDRRKAVRQGAGRVDFLRRALVRRRPLGEGGVDGEAHVRFRAVASGGPLRRLDDELDDVDVPDVLDGSADRLGGTPDGEAADAPSAGASERPLGRRRRLARLGTRFGIALLLVVGVFVVPVSIVPAFASTMSSALADVGVASSRTSLSEFEGDLSTGLPSDAQVAVDGPFTGAPALPRVTQADPVALDLIGYGPVELTAPALQAITAGRSSVGLLADPATISSSSINPVIRSLFTSRPAAGATPPSPIPAERALSRAEVGTTAYIATSTAPTTGMAMVCPGGRRAEIGGGSSEAPRSQMVASTATDASGATPVVLQSEAARGWSINFSEQGMITLWVICGA